MRAYDQEVRVEVEVVGKPAIVVDGRRIEVAGDRLAEYMSSLCATHAVKPPLK